MTLVNIDLKNAGYEADPDDRVVFYSPANRNEQGTIISTAETSVPLVDGQASKELAPGPVVVKILAQGVADTREKTGYVPDLPDPVSLWDIILDWTPALVDQGILAILTAVESAQSAIDEVLVPSIEGARDEALAQVNDAVDAAVASRALWVSSGLEALASKLAFDGAGQHTMAVVADSTLNDNNEAVRIFDRLYGALLPTSVRHVYHRWLPASNAWEHTVNQEGEVTPASDGEIVDDTFTRTVTDLVGSTPDTGPAWVGTAGAWVTNGSQAVATNAGQLRTDAGVRNITLEIDLDLVTTVTGTAQSHRYYLGSSPTSSTTGLWVTVNITTTGTMSWALWLTSGSSSAQIGATKYGGTIGIGSNNGTPQKMTLRAVIDIQNVSATLTSSAGSETITGTITEAQYGALGTSVTLNSLGPAPGIRLDRVQVSVPPQPASGDMLDVWNGAIAGAKFSTFNSAKLDQMFDGVHVDVLMLSMGHNNGTQTGDAFVSEVDAWVGLWISKHPETQGIVWISQNPQFPPATSIAPHRERQLSMRVNAKRKWEYIPGYEAFAALPDGGQSMVGADGIHPTAPSGGATTGDFGAVLTATAMLDAVRDRV